MLQRLFIIPHLCLCLLALGITNRQATAHTPAFEAASASDLDQWLKSLQNLQANDQQMEEAIQAAKGLQSLDDAALIRVLTACDKATPLGRNWLCSVATRLFAKSTRGNQAALETFLKDESHDGEARYLVFSWLTASKPDLRKKMLGQMLNDRSPEIRFAATALAIEESATMAKDSAPYRDRLKDLLESARHPSQVVDIIKKLKEAGVEIAQAAHFGFLSKWKVIGPFDNRDQSGFDVAYPVEKDLIAGKVNLQQKYGGKHGEVTWKDAEGDATEGAVDLNPLYNDEKGAQEKGALVYAYTTFESEKGGPADLRLGCINANKVWLNGELIISNEVYHADMQVDQYIASVTLKPGPNSIVVKVCQNEQTEQWAQRWTYQLRVCDSTGKAVKN